VTFLSAEDSLALSASPASAEGQARAVPGEESGVPGSPAADDPGGVLTSADGGRGSEAPGELEIAEPEPVLLLEPRDGLPPVVDTEAALADAVAALRAGEGPAAVDAERASGYRYGQRAYLVQIRRAGTGTLLIDPAACPDLSSVRTALAGVEWVLHAASQDLPCLAEVGLVPDALFDTELAARLAGHERVGLGAITEKLLGYRLEKGHSAVDWSTRPLPEPWLRYAALDVELLVDLRDALERDLREQGKLEWAQEEFEALVLAAPKPPVADPWRRTSGIHKIRNRRQLAAVRALWQTRDRVARRRDLAPGRVLPDSAIVAAALAGPSDATELARLPVFSGPRMRRTTDVWWQALASVASMTDADLPRAAGPGNGLPPTNRWAERDPEAAARLARARAGLAALSEQYRTPVENLLEPALVRRLAWSPPEPVDVGSVSAALAEGGARRWQIGLAAEPLAEALSVD
jgi:ribonuclease D